MREVYFKYIKPVFGNKYIFAVVLFGVWMTFFDENDLLSRFNYDQKIRKLNSEITYYEKEIEQSTRKKIELQSSNENLEKFAREQYLMKKANEDIFIIEN
ncbi:MAG: septum formation initiator family protein [Prevotellaceae bacterium]|jgi:cell division protein FtsB|nr:septum formation initiator family protein [Prevotellaceae bacterium]